MAKPGDVHGQHKGGGGGYSFQMVTQTQRDRTPPPPPASEVGTPLGDGVLGY